MNIGKKTGIACLMITLAAAGCLWFLPGREDAVEGIVIEKDSHYRVVDKGDYTYFYTIYNTEGKVVREEDRFREPMISYVDSETIEIYGGAGTGVWFCVYYDIVHDRFSESFECPVAARYQKVAYPEFREEETVLVIRDMFDAGKCYQEFPLDFGRVFSPVVSAEFKSEDTLLITYEAGEFYGDQEKTKLLTLEEGKTQKGEITANSKPEIKDKSESQKIMINRTKDWIRYKHDLYRDMLHGEYPLEEIPFVDEESFALIREAYAGINYAAEFTECDPAVYETYKKEFGRLIQNQAPFLDKETGREVYIKDWVDLHLLVHISDYSLFDVNGDGLPDLCVNAYGNEAVIIYDPDQGQFVLWKLFENMYIIGARKAVISHEDIGSTISDYVELDAEGNVELNTMFFTQPEDLFHWTVGDPVANMVMLPNYADKNKKCEITEEMKQQGIYEKSSGQWFFRITDEQFAQLEELCEKGIDEAWLERRKRTFTYEELLGVDYVDDELYEEIKDIYQNIDLSVSFDSGDVTKYDLYKEKFKQFIDGETTVRVRETGEKLYLYDLGEFRTDAELGKYDIDRYRYYFFDINGDDNPELCVTDKARYTYVFQYDETQDQIVLWKEYIGGVALMGTQKLIWAGGWAGHGMIRLDENGERVFFVHFKQVGGAPYENRNGEYGYLVFLPEYIEFTDEMREQAIYDVTDEEYCFRVTEEQYEELTEGFYEADREAYAALDEVTYTYGELFE